MKIKEKRTILIEMDYSEFTRLVDLIAEVKISGHFEKNKNLQKSMELMSRGFQSFKV